MSEEGTRKMCKKELALEYKRSGCYIFQNAHKRIAKQSITNAFIEGQAKKYV